MSKKKNFKLFLLTSFLAISTFCLSVNAMESKKDTTKNTISQENLNMDNKSIKDEDDKDHDLKIDLENKSNMAPVKNFKFLNTYVPEATIKPFHSTMKIDLEENKFRVEFSHPDDISKTIHTYPQSHILPPGVNRNKPQENNDKDRQYNSHEINTYENINQTTFTNTTPTSHVLYFDIKNNATQKNDDFADFLNYYNRVIINKESK